MEIEVAMESKKKEKSKYGKYDEYEIESAARTLHEAEEIKNDPEKMKYVKMFMKNKINSMESTINSIDDIKAARQNLKEEASSDNESEMDDES